MSSSPPKTTADVTPRPRPFTRAYLLALVPLLLLSCAAEKGEADVAAADPAPVPVVVETIAKTTKELRRRYSGYTHPWEAHGVGFLVAGRITAIDVKEGDRVKQGQVIATLAGEDYELVKKLAEVQIRTLRPNLRRVRRLVKSNALPQAELDKLQGQYDAAVTQKRQAERQVGYTVLEAPCDGVVLEKRASVGQVTNAGLPVVIILDLSRLKAKFGVTQRDLQHFHEGAELKVTFPGAEGPRTGSVYHIADIPDTRTRTYDVVLSVDNTDATLRAGMMGHTTLVTERLEGLFVPLDAVKHNTRGEHVIMLTSADGAQARERIVELGRSFGDRVALTKGVDVGDRVIVSGQHYVRDGEAIAIKPAAPAKPAPEPSTAAPPSPQGTSTTAAPAAPAAPTSSTDEKVEPPKVVPGGAAAPTASVVGGAE